MLRSRRPPCHSGSEFAGCRLPDAAGEGRAPLFRARAPPLFSSVLLTQKAKARGSCPPSPHLPPTPSLTLPADARKEGGREEEEEEAGPYDGCQRGEGQAGCWPQAAPGGALCSARGCSISTPAAWQCSTTNFPQRKSVESPTTSDEGVRPRPA